MKKCIRRLLAFAMCFALVLSLSPSIAFATEDISETEEISGGDKADDAEIAGDADYNTDGVEIASDTDDIVYYNVWVGGIQVTSANKSNVLGNNTVSFTPATSSSMAKLKLNNVNIKGGFDNGQYIAAIYSEASIEIVLEGDNVLGAPVEAIDNYAGYSVTHGIAATNWVTENYDIKVSGTGNLEIYDWLAGIYGNNITINSTGTISVCEYGEYGMACCLKAIKNVTINSGNIDLKSYESRCVFGQITVNGGTLDMGSYGSNNCIDHTIKFASTYKPYVLSGISKEAAKETSNPEGSDMLNKKYINISEKKYSIYIDSMTNGKVTTTKTTAKPGEKVTLNVTPDAGYSLASLDVLYGKGNEVKYDASYSFTMPESGVIVQATFAKWEDMTLVKPTGIAIDSNNASGVTARALFDTSIDYSKVAIAWYIIEEGSSTPKEISDYKYNNGTISFRMPKGVHTIIVETRLNNDPNTTSQCVDEVEANIGIKGICQMPNPNGSGYLIGVEGKDDPNHEYYYELLILDCTKYAQGLPAWVATTGKRKTGSNCCWMKWDPQYGYYWTLFRLYDKDMKLIDEQCYGFANI